MGRERALPYSIASYQARARLVLGGDTVELSPVGDGEVWRLSESHIHPGEVGWGRQELGLSHESV